MCLKVSAVLVLRLSAIPEAEECRGSEDGDWVRNSVTAEDFVFRVCVLESVDLIILKCEKNFTD